MQLAAIGTILHAKQGQTAFKTEAESLQFSVTSVNLIVRICPHCSLGGLGWSGLQRGVLPTRLFFAFTCGGQYRQRVWNNIESVDVTAVSFARSLDDCVTYKLYKKYLILIWVLLMFTLC